MNVHEYQAKELMRQFGISVLKGGVAATPAEAVEVAKNLIPKFGLLRPRFTLVDGGKAAARMPTMASTIISSSRVKPVDEAQARCRPGLACECMGGPPAVING